MSAEDATIKVGGSSDDESNKTRDSGIIAAYVLFAIGAVLIIIVCVWISCYLRRKRKRKREADASSPTIIYDGTNVRTKPITTLNNNNIKATELKSTTKPLYVETNNNMLTVPVRTEKPASENGIIVSGFNTKTKPIAVSTMPRTAYVVEDSVDSPRSASTKVYAIDDSGLRVQTKKSTNVKKAYVVPVRAVSSERLYTIDRQQKHRRQYSDTAKVIPVVYANTKKQPSSRLTHHSDTQAVTSQSMPTLLRIEPMNLPKNHNQPQVFRLVGTENATASVHRREGSHVENWVERHHAQPVLHTANVSRDNILYQPDEDAIDADMQMLRQRTRSLTEENHDALLLRWSPSMRKKLEMKKQREEAILNSARSLPTITKTNTDGFTETLAYKKPSEDQLY